MSHVWWLQPWHCNKKKMVQMCCLMRKSQASSETFKKAASHIKYSQSNWSWFWFFPELLSCCSTCKKCLVFLKFTKNEKGPWHCCLKKGKSCKSTWNLLPQCGLIRFKIDIFQLKSSKRQMTIYNKATEEDYRNVYNKYVCHKPDALWWYWRSIGTFA